ncbi:hypothetical protein [Streptomyces lunaelactis]|uniref:hypothetical protein n=1 Tax=Streptomyces lunaelactis TaxID=1535768 RepID=UPI00158537AC|nr:hypothetical protein [Streptomyces lunaelactis]NUL13261.1 hypothetical protein [Streptomyces lunaelactis]
MKCDEPLFEDGQKYSVYSCRLDLGHPGAHEDARYRKYPRPIPAEPDWDVQELLDTSAPRDAYGLEERSYPVIVETRQVYVIWVDAESADRALAYHEDPCDLNLNNHQSIDGDWTVRRPDQFELASAFESRRTRRIVGPEIACPDCGALSLKRAWCHKPLNKCHGPIEWRETHSDRLEWRYRREFKAASPVHAARKAVAA